MAKIDERIEAAKKRLEQLKNEKSVREARERAMGAKKARTRENRRKLLVGAMVLHDTESDPEATSRLRAKLDKFLTRAHERAVFDLPPLEVKK